MRGAPSLVVCLAAVSCGGSAVSSVHPDGTACDGRQLLIVNCSGCHDGSPGDAGDLDLGAPDLVARLLNKPSSGPRCATLGAPLIGSQGGGLLLDKLATPPPCGDRMPQGSFPLTADEISCLTAFVAAGVADQQPP